MSANDIKIPSSTLAELRGVLVRALSRENLSVTDKLAIRKSQSSSALKINYTWSSNYVGKKAFAYSRGMRGELDLKPKSETFPCVLMISVYLVVVLD